MERKNQASLLSKIRFEERKRKIFDKTTGLDLTFFS